MTRRSRLGRWLGSVPGVKSLTALGHAGEGTFLERDEQLKGLLACHSDKSARGSCWRW